MYWWSRYGNFAPGIGNFPHSGQVIAYYRVKRGFKSQEKLAIALGCSKKLVEEMEANTNMKGPDSLERRQAISRLLRIPPTLLALDWHFMVNNSIDGDTEKLLQSSDSLFLPYQSVLGMARNYLFNGGTGNIDDIIDKNLNSIIPLAKSMPDFEKEPWLELLCRYYQLSTSFALRRLEKDKALYYARKAIKVASELKNIPLLTAAHYRRVRLHLDLMKGALDQNERSNRLIDAKGDVQVCLMHIDDIPVALKGNVYLIAAETYAMEARDEKTKSICKHWQGKAETLAYRYNEDEDDTYIKLNLFALHLKGQADLIYRNGIFSLAVTLEVPTPDPNEPEGGILGVDLGIVNLATDSEGETFRGEAVERNRKRMNALRQRLQKRGTRSAKRHLKKLSGKEARFKRNTNHVISKRIVQKTKNHRQGIAIEDLRHIRSRTESTVRKSQRNRHASWAFGQLRSFLSYKAALAGVPLHTVDPRNTSRTCHACGHCAQENRKRQASFLCRACGLAAPADWNAAINISRAEVKQPLVSSLSV